ncbi:protein PIN-LIKES 7 [Malania oleifera]|uniref:protein PIN-LIKES 7 n=1 Tax=Malania oleifera TaxID=397392 RepID=UPI0025AE6901|nr:protein PIN-LIKES 7 [Malania oleifera]XP_057964181.1 protein PIN-LIKES 7 [Malania oleifera]XP_057964188.1 protein PIN-LIKES 7 [Malania oleifera]XP_057964196.1 protein PIN-LIKES 7 [Malania oleifera]
MGFWTLLEAASIPIVEVLIISMLGAFMSTSYCNLLPPDARKYLNKIVFMVFTPCLIFASLAKTVTLQDIISWWFMPVNIGLTFLFGGMLGWVVVKLLKPQKHLEGLIVATSSSGNLGNLMLIVIPAICRESGNPFGSPDVCSSVGLSYASFSMALGGFFIWTYTFQLIKTSALKHKEAALPAPKVVIKAPNKDLDDDNRETHLLLEGDGQHQVSIVVPSTKSIEEHTDYYQHGESTTSRPEKASFWGKLMGVFHQIVEELLAPPTLAAFVGLIFGATTWLRKLIIGDTAPLRVIQDSVKLLGDGTIPCITLILGGNLTQGLRSATLGPGVIIGVICVRYVMLPLIGIGVVKASAHLGFLSPDPLYHFVLMVQFTLPPAMNIGTMTQLFDIGQEECSVLYLWTYLAAAIALTVWSTVYMWILS